MQFNGIQPDGSAEFVAFDNDDDSMIVRKVQDATPFLERAHEAQASGSWRGEDNTFWHYASVPVTIIEEMYRKGINFFDEADARKVFAEINLNYPWLKCTPKFVW
jgi:hypothetical protein